IPKKSKLYRVAAGILVARLRGNTRAPMAHPSSCPSRPMTPTPVQESGPDVPLRPSSLLVAPMTEVTRLLSALEGGDPHAAAQLLPLVYDELRKLAAQKLAHEAPGQTLQATALVHEAYLRLVGAEEARPWDSRGHFFAAA